MKAEVRGGGNNNGTQISAQNNSISGGALNYKGCLGNLDGACTEKLLLHCASALESNDVTLAQQVMWVLNNVASPVGDPNQRLTSWFLRALISRVSRDVVCPSGGGSSMRRRLMAVTELAGYVDLIPWHRFGFCASNSAIIKAVERYSKVHILDFSTTHCMQWPTLIEALSKRSGGPPSLRISVFPSWRPPVPPFLNMSPEEVGNRLSNFAKSKNVPFHFNSIQPDNSNCNFSYDLLLEQISPSNLILNDDEALVINCQNWLRYLPPDNNDDHDDDYDNYNNYHYNKTTNNILSLRDAFLSRIKELGRPCIITVVDEDSDMGSSKNLTSRITACFNYLWIPFDALETFLSKDSSQRLEYESDIGQKIENIIGLERLERHESGIKFSERMRKNGFVSVPFTDETVKEVKLLLDEHASGWGMKKEDDDDMLVLTWKGHNSIFATAWILYPEVSTN